MKTASKKQAVATRRLRPRSGGNVVANVYRPVRKGPDDWRCAFTITGLAEPIEAAVRGVDGLQALMVAPPAPDPHDDDPGSPKSCPAQR